MTITEENIVMIYGGYCISDHLSDGVLIDSDTKQVVRNLNSGDFKFACSRNRHCVTENGAVIAVVLNFNRYKLIEVSLADFSITVMKDFGC